MLLGVNLTDALYFGRCHTDRDCEGQVSADHY